MGQPVAYATCYMIKLMRYVWRQGNTDQLGHMILNAQLGNMVNKLHSNLVSLYQGYMTLQSINEELYKALIALQSSLVKQEEDRNSKRKKDEDAYSRISGDLDKIKCVEKAEERCKPWSLRPPLNQKRALGAYAWICGYLSYKHHDCVQCSLRKLGAFSCCDDLGERPFRFNVATVGDFVVVHPQDAVKAAFYHNLLTLYAFHFAIDADADISYILEWENLVLFPTSGHNPSTSSGHPAV